MMKIVKKAQMTPRINSLDAGLISVFEELGDVLMISGNPNQSKCAYLKSLEAILKFQEAKRQSPLAFFHIRFRLKMKMKFLKFANVISQRDWGAFCEKGFTQLRNNSTNYEASVHYNCQADSPIRFDLILESGLYYEGVREVYQGDLEKSLEVFQMALKEDHLNPLTRIKIERVQSLLRICEEIKNKECNLAMSLGMKYFRKCSTKRYSSFSIRLKRQMIECQLELQNPLAALEIYQEILETCKTAFRPDLARQWRDFIQFCDENCLLKNGICLLQESISKSSPPELFEVFHQAKVLENFSLHKIFSTPGFNLGKDDRFAKYKTAYSKGLSFFHEDKLIGRKAYLEAEPKVKEQLKQFFTLRYLQIKEAWDNILPGTGRRNREDGVRIYQEKGLEGLLQ